MNTINHQLPKIIAEVGCNHKGDMKIARELIFTAGLFCKADIVKFQKRNSRELLTPAQYNSPHPNPINAYGRTYGEHREFLEFNIQQHKQLKAWCEEAGVEYSTSVWDLTSAQEMVNLQPALLKIPSASNLHWQMLDYLCNNFAGEIHLSLGMTTKQEEEEIITFFIQRNRAKNLVLYACTSGYPVDFKDICLFEITRLKTLYGSTVQAIGFSGHHLGIAADIAAITLGAQIIERHFTLDRTWKGTDHAASLEPDGLRKLTRDIHNVSEALAYKSEDLLAVEIPQRTKLKYIDSATYIKSASPSPNQVSK